MKRAILIFCSVSLLLSTQQTSAAIKYKRYARCATGSVTEKTCECHKLGSAHYRYCHAGQECRLDGICRE